MRNRFKIDCDYDYDIDIDEDEDEQWGRKNRWGPDSAIGPPDPHSHGLSRPLRPLQGPSSQRLSYSCAARRVRAAAVVNCQTSPCITSPVGVRESTRH